MTDGESLSFKVDVNEDEAAEFAVADLIGFRSNPQKTSNFAISMVRSLYKDSALEVAAQSNGERTKAQLEALSIHEVSQAVEFLAFSSGYLAARMFHVNVGDGPVLSRLLMPANESIAEAIRKESLDRAIQYLPALSEIHDNRAAPRDSRLVVKLLSQYLAVLIEDPRPSTLDILLLGYDQGETHAPSNFSARQIADTLDRARLWSTLGWRRGLAERRFRVGPRAAYLENIAGDVRVILDPDRKLASFSDIRRLRLVELSAIKENPHPCDDEIIAAWIENNCALAQGIWLKPSDTA